MLFTSVKSKGTEYELIHGPILNLSPSTSSAGADCWNAVSANRKRCSSNVLTLCAAGIIGRKANIFLPILSALTMPPRASKSAGEAGGRGAGQNGGVG